MSLKNINLNGISDNISVEVEEFEYTYETTSINSDTVLDINPINSVPSNKQVVGISYFYSDTAVCTLMVQNAKTGRLTFYNPSDSQRSITPKLTVFVINK